MILSRKGYLDSGLFPALKTPMLLLGILIILLAVSFLVGFTMLVFAQGLSIPKTLLLAVLGALAGTVTELFTSSEYDTITVPFAIEAVLLLLNTLQ